MFEIYINIKRTKYTFFESTLAKLSVCMKVFLTSLLNNVVRLTTVFYDQTKVNILLQDDQIYMVVFFWYLVKDDLSGVH